jgi:hypothetical protein
MAVPSQFSGISKRKIWAIVGAISTVARGELSNCLIVDSLEKIKGTCVS